ncbi:MAG: DNA ligase D, partial [Polyangiaceae bacterium]
PGFGALLLAVKEKDGFRYAGKVGTGFSDKVLTDLSKKLRKLIIPTTAVLGAPRMRDATWVEPRLVAEVSFTEWTRDGSLRHPSFLGLREDKEAGETVRERARSPSKKKLPSLPAAKGNVVDGVTISHPERVVDEDSKITKLDLARYHELVVPLLLPYADHRPLALVRCPEGTKAKCFFQKKRWAGSPSSVHPGKAAGQEVLYVTDANGLISLVQFGAVELHGWGSRFPHAAKPDWIVMDLDPDEGLPFPKVIEAALEMREVLRSIGLESFVKTTGGKGLHIVAPFEPEFTWTEVKSLTQAIAHDFARRKPEDFTANMAKRARTGKIFVDYHRNGEGATAVLPYSPRTKPGMTVAMPVPWRDLRHVDPLAFTVRTVPAHLKKRKKDPWAAFFSLGQKLPDEVRHGPRANRDGA